MCSKVIYTLIVAAAGMAQKVAGLNAPAFRSSERFYSLGVDYSAKVAVAVLRVMKPNKFLTASLIVNLALASAIAFLFKTSQKPSVPAPPGQTLSANEEPRRPKIRKAVTTGDASAETLDPKQIHWRDVESADYKAYIANLRAIECPEQTIRDIITAELNKNVASKRAAIRRGGQQFVYWKADEEFTDYYPKLRQERAAERQKSALLKELLGVDPNEEARREAGTYEYLEWQYDFLTGDKRDKVRDIQEKYVDFARQLKSNGSSDPEVQRKVSLLYQQRLFELGTVLTPQEVEDYDLRSSSLAESLRYSLDGFDPSPDEFRQIYRIKKSSGDEGAALTDEAIRTVLGEERYTKYRRAQDHSYKELYRLSKARDLAADTADKIYDIKSLTEETVRKIRADPTLTAEQKNASRREIANDAQKTIVELLGEKNVTLYRSRGGWWIQQLGH